MQSFSRYRTLVSRALMRLVRGSSRIMGIWISYRDSRYLGGMFCTFLYIQSIYHTEISNATPKF